VRDISLTWVAAGAALVVGIGVCAWEVTRPDSVSPAPPGPSHSPSMPPFFSVVQVPVDGFYYNCVIYGPNGLSCDWDHPLIGPLDIPTPERSLA
jgi:hypothetical protein